MEKSRLGISINLFAAMLYFLGAINNVFVIAIAAGYVLFFEQNEKLKRTAVKALIIMVFLTLLTTLLNWLTGLSSSIASTLYTYFAYNTEVYYNYVHNLFQFIAMSVNNVAHIFEMFILIILGFRAYKQIDVKIKWIDKILDKHF